MTEQQFDSSLFWVPKIAVAVACVVAGAAGVAAGVHFSTAPPPATGTAVSAAPASAEQVRAATTDLCTRFAVGYAAMPDQQRSPLDVMPMIDYVARALADNPAADPSVRAAVTDSLRGSRIEAAWLSHAQAEGAIRPPNDPHTQQGNVADQHVFDLCRDY